MQFSETLTEKHVCGHFGTTRSSSAATTVGHPRTSSWSAGIPARIALPTTPHPKMCHANPVNRRRRAGNLTRLHLVKPCRRGRRRSRGPHPGPRASLPASLCPPCPITRRVKSCLSIKANVREISPDYNLWNPAGEGAGAPRGASSWSAGIPARIDSLPKP